MQEEDIEGPPFPKKPPWRVCAPCAMMMARRFVSQGMVRTAFICIKRSLNLCGWRLAEVIVQFAGASSPWGWGWSLGAWRILHRCSAMGGKEKLPMHDASVSWSLCAGAICSAFGRSLHAMASSFHAAESLSWYCFRFFVFLRGLSFLV